MLYHMHELNRTLLNPLVAWSGAAARALSAPDNWLSRMPGMDRVAAGYELLYGSARITRSPRSTSRRSSRTGARHRSSKKTSSTPVLQPVALQALQRRSGCVEGTAADPVVLVVAPLSGHHATLLRDTVRRAARSRDVHHRLGRRAHGPARRGPFHLDDYVGYMRRFIAHVGGAKAHVISCASRRCRCSRRFR